jgi:hypothetical protein
MRWRYIAVTLVGVLLLTACASVSGSGTLKTETRPVSNFSAIELSGSGNLVIEQTGTESLTIEAEDNILPLLTSDVSGGTLHLGEKDNTIVMESKPINYRLTVRDLRGLTVSGSGHVTASTITAGKLNVTLSGSGGIVLGGTADPQELTISGSGQYDATGLASKVVTADISGSGHAVVKTSEVLDATISGSGSLTYIGNPTVTQHISGSGSVSKQ